MKKYLKSKLFYFLFLLICLLVIYLGGGKVLFYLISSVLIFYAGYKVNSVVQLYKDYKLALKFNSLAFSQKQYEKLLQENEALKNELKQATERLQLHHQLNN